MKKIIGTVTFMVAILAALTFAGNSIAGPFGLHMGMKLSEFDRSTLESRGKKEAYTTKSVPNPHPAFQFYSLYISQNEGLYWVKAIGKAINTSVYGTELRTEFEGMHKKLAKLYGKNKAYDFLRTGSIWNEPKDFMTGLRKKERLLKVYWEAKNGSTLPENIAGITLNAHVLNTNKGYITVEYIFKNTDECRALLAAGQDDSL